MSGFAPRIVGRLARICSAYDWQRSELTDVTAKVVIYDAFIEGRFEAAKHLART